MTPAARVAAAIGLLDSVLAGAAGEQVLTAWGRANRYAGSGDRSAVRDLVFDSLRCLRSRAALGGEMSGRGLMIGAIRARGEDPAAIFTGERFAPAPLTEAEAAHLSATPDMTAAETLDCPDWLEGDLRASLAGAFSPVMEALRHRAPVFLRANLRKATPDQAIAALAADDIGAEPHPLADTALLVTRNAGRLRSAAAYRDGLVELQDAASQAVVAALPLRAGLRVLDYCAGGGGKALAIAGRAEATVFAHDADPGRMADLGPRAKRAGVAIRHLATRDLAHHAPFDLVVCDAPCSGSGAWRRAPEAKWRLTEARLADLTRSQAGILDAAAPLVAPGGTLAYATCSLLARENRQQIDAFAARSPGWTCTRDLRLTPLDGGDGFYLALLTRS